MNLNLATFPHRSGAVLNPNLTPENIRLGDILTHRYDHHKVVVACIDGSHLLLVDKDGRISRQRIRRVIGRYSRRANDIHGLNNARLALVKAVSLGYRQPVPEQDGVAYGPMGLFGQYLPCGPTLTAPSDFSDGLPNHGDTAPWQVSLFFYRRLPCLSLFPVR